MAKNRQSRSQHVSATIRPHRVTKRKLASTVSFTVCRSLETPKAALDWLGITYSQAGSEYARLMSGRPQTRQSVYKALAGKRLSDDWMQVIGQLISNRLTRICGETIGVVIMQNSPLKIMSYRYCDDCRAMYAIDRPDTRRCPRCRK